MPTIDRIARIANCADAILVASDSRIIRSRRNEDGSLVELMTPDGVTIRLTLHDLGISVTGFNPDMTKVGGMILSDELPNNIATAVARELASEFEFEL